MKSVTPPQIRKIYALRHEKCIDIDDLHTLIFNMTQKESIKELTIKEAIDVIDFLSDKRQAPKEMATNAQIQTINDLCQNLGWLKPNGLLDTKRQNAFLTARFNTGHVSFLSKTNASKVIEALKSMVRRGEKVE